MKESEKKRKQEGGSFMHDFEILLPTNIDELKQALRQTTPKSKILGGGTDLVISLKEGRLSPDLVIDLSAIEELTIIKEENDSLLIGAGATFSEIKRNHAVKKYFPCLAEAASQVGSNQIRNRGTIGGNVANASPAGDTLPVLSMLGALIRTLNSDGEIREKTIEQFISGPGKTTMDYNEAIVGILIPFPKEAWRTSFAKLGNRSAVTIAMLNGSMGVRLKENTFEIEDVRLVLGAISIKPVRVPEIENILKKNSLTQEVLSEFIQALSKLVENTAPIEFDMLYKKEAVRGFAVDLLSKLIPERITRDGIVLDPYRVQ